MRKYLFQLVVFFCFAYISALSQVKDEGLSHFPVEHTGDTTEVNALLVLSDEMISHHRDSSIKLAKNALILSDSIGYAKGLIKANYAIGNNYFHQNQQDSALTYFGKSLTVSRQIGDSMGIQSCLRRFGSVYMQKGRYTESLDYLQASLSIALALNDSLSIATTFTSMGKLYFLQNNYDKSLTYSKKILEIRKSWGELKDQALCMGNIGLIYMSLENYGEALYFNRRSFDILDSLNETCWLMYPSVNLGHTYLELDQIDSSLKYLQISYDLSVQCGNAEGVCQSLLDLGTIHHEQGRFDLAERELLEDYSIARSHDLKVPKVEATEALYKLYESAGKIAEALKFLKITSELKDQMFNEDRTEKLTRIELNYVFEQERDSLEFQKQSELLIINSKLEKQRMVQYFTVVGLLITMIFLFVIYRNYRLKQMANLNLEKKNEIQRENLVIEEKMRKQLEMDNNQKSRSLTATSIQLLNLNEKLTETIDQLRNDVAEPDERFNKVLKELNNLRCADSHWDGIKMHFENVHPDFFEKLERKFPNLSANDHKILAFMKMKLSNKEIAVILNVTRRAVEQSKRRIKKKLEMDVDNSDILGFVEGVHVDDL